MLNQVLVYRIANLTIIDLRKELFRKTLRGDIAHFNGEGTSDLMSRFAYDMESLLNAHVEFFGKLIREPLKMIACLLGAGFISWRLLLFSMILAPPAVVIVRRWAKALKKANRKLMEEMSEMYDILDETFQGIKVVKAFTMERHKSAAASTTATRNTIARRCAIGRYDAIARPLIEVLGMGTICVAFLAGAVSRAQ